LPQASNNFGQNGKSDTLAQAEPKGKNGKAGADPYAMRLADISIELQNNKLLKQRSLKTLGDLYDRACMSGQSLEHTLNVGLGCSLL